MIIKDYKLLRKQAQLKKHINSLNKEKIYIIYFNYNLSFKNIWHSPLLLTTKLLSFITRKPYIDHVCHISRFIWDDYEQKYIAKIFEASIDRGMEQNDLFDKVKNIKGKSYIEELDVIVNKEKAKLFELRYYGVPYSKELAALSGIDLKIFDKLYKTKASGGFCSWLVANFLEDQGVKLNIENGNPFEMTPSDIYSLNLGKKTILYESFK